VTYPEGGGDLIMLFDSVPFVLVRPSFKKEGVTKEVKVFSGTVPRRELKTFGTGGLLAADKNPGSYAWLSVVDPTNRTGLVMGWVTQDRGSGVLFTKDATNGIEVSAKIEYGRLKLGDKAEELETLAIGFFDDARVGLESWADQVAKVYDIKLKPQPSGYCTWYSRPYGGASDEKHLAELVAFSAKELAPYGFSVVQIDDKWQAGVSTNGPKREFMRSAPDGPYPSGMKAAADNIKAHGLTAGIWFMPFAATYYDPAFKDHQDWFVKREDGKPYETSWGGTCLDMTRTDARDYLRNLAKQISRDWGYKYFKVDGLWTGTATKQQYVNSGYKDDNMGDAVLSNPEKTNIEAYRDGLKTLREGAGSDVFILGCNGPQNMRSYAGAFGLVDGMRVGPDNGSEWSRLTRGPIFGSRHYFLHGRVWYNDPDPVYVRDSMPLKQAQLICSWVAISGQMNLSSEWLPGLPAERLQILKQTMPPHELKARPADLFENDPPRWWTVSDNERSVVAVFNWSEKDQEMEYSLPQLGFDGKATYAAFDFWKNTALPPTSKTLKLNVPAQSCRVVALRRERNQPQVISTSRHVTQGMVDLMDERWDGKNFLEGKSAVVANDPYELRVVVGDRKRPNLAVMSDDEAAGVKITGVDIENGLLRVTIASPVSRVVRWALKFD
jgi:hypothetical protein